jgi:hypothetical protein
VVGRLAFGAQVLVNFGLWTNGTSLLGFWFLVDLIDVFVVLIYDYTLL